MEAKILLVVANGAHLSNIESIKILLIYCVAASLMEEFHMQGNRSDLERGKLSIFQIA